MTQTFTLSRRRFGSLVLAAAAAPLAMSSEAFAGQGTITLHIASGGFIIGASGGHGELTFRGVMYPLTAGGINAGFTIGAAAEDLVGTVLNINAPEQINGTYAQAAASAAFGPGVGAVTMTNPNGVVLNLQGLEAGFMASLNLGGLTIALK
ncbi:MAG: hypothetical protein U1E46_08905 [Hyphomicrobiales bacterium]